MATLQLRGLSRTARWRAQRRLFHLTECERLPMQMRKIKHTLASTMAQSVSDSVAAQDYHFGNHMPAANVERWRRVRTSH